MSSAQSVSQPASPKRRFRPGLLIQNAVALMVSSGGSALLGVAFWGVAAHLSPTADIGRASAEIAAMTLLANIAQLSFGQLFERFLPLAGSKSRPFVQRAYGMCLGVALAAGVVYLAAGFGHSFLPAGFGWALLFVVAVFVWTIFVLQDSVLTALRAARWVPVENILFGVAKLCLLPLLILLTATQGIFLAWSVPVVGAVVAVSWYLFRKRIPEYQANSEPRQDMPSNREIISLAFARYASGLITVFTPSIVTLIVIQRLGAVASADYYVAALVSNGLALLIWNLTTSFLVEASTEPEELRRHVKVTVRAAVVLLVPTVAIGVVLAPQILGIFGATYAEHGTALLRMLLLSLFGTAVTAFYTSLAWLDKRVWWLAVRDLAAAGIYFGILFAFIGRFGILVIGIAALVTSGMEGVFFLPISIRRYRTLAVRIT